VHFDLLNSAQTTTKTQDDIFCMNLLQKNPLRTFNEIGQGRYVWYRGDATDLLEW